MLSDSKVLKSDQERDEIWFKFYARPFLKLPRE